MAASIDTLTLGGQQVRLAAWLSRWSHAPRAHTLPTLKSSLPFLDSLLPLPLPPLARSAQGLQRAASIEGVASRQGSQTGQGRCERGRQRDRSRGAGGGAATTGHRRPTAGLLPRTHPARSCRRVALIFIPCACLLLLPTQS